MLIGGTITVLSAFWFENNRRLMRKSVRNIYQDKGIIPPFPDELS
jgi:hypothetical protein